MIPGRRRIPTPRSRTEPRRSQRGATTLLTICVLAFALVMVMGTVAVGTAAVVEQRTQAVADVVALAAAHDVDAAAVVARGNGAAVVALDVATDGSVAVTVQVGAHRARAAARTD